jgi:subtilisin-like proprotein convertase family protein
MHRSVWLLAAVVAVAGTCLTAPALAGAATFSNTAPITIPDFGPATPYPSTIDVSGVAGVITDVNVTLTGFSHTCSSDVSALLVGPTGASVVLMNDPGSSPCGAVSDLTFTFDDSASSFLACSGSLVSGTYKPTGTTQPPVCFFPNVFPPPAPAGGYGDLLSGFNGTNPNGTWSLYVFDDASSDAGSISGGWSLDITAGTTPEQKISDLQDLVAGMGIHHGITNALESKLQHALDALAADDTAGACYWMQSFVDLVNAQTGKKISSGNAQQLIDAANEIRTQLGC